MPTFATPFKKRVLEKRKSRLIFEIFTEGASWTGKLKKKLRKQTSSLKRLETVQASTEKIQFIEKR